MNLNKKIALTSIAAATLALFSATSQATLATSSSGGTTTVLATVTGTWSTSANVVAGGFNVTSAPGSAVWYGDSAYGLGGNGTWGNFAWVGGYCYSGACTATFDLGGLYSSAGGFMTYLPGNGSAVLEALAFDGSILESYDLTIAAAISTPGGFNDGAYRGIDRSSADIAYLRITGAYSLLHDITLDGGAVPEPSSLALVGIALAGLGLRRRFC